MDKSKLELEILRDDFQLHNRTEGKSEKTVLWYNEVLDLFIRWLKETWKPTNIGSVDEHQVRLFVLYLQSRQWHGRKYLKVIGKRSAIMTRNVSSLDSVNVPALRTQGGRRAALLVTSKTTLSEIPASAAI